jgi:hypothetical protein
VSAPEEGRNENTYYMYNQLQEIINKTNKNHYIIVSGNVNARVREQRIS